MRAVGIVLGLALAGCKGSGTLGGTGAGETGALPMDSGPTEDTADSEDTEDPQETEHSEDTEDASDTEDSGAALSYDIRLRLEGGAPDSWRAGAMLVHLDEEDLPEEVETVVSVPWSKQQVELPVPHPDEAQLDELEPGVWAAVYLLYAWEDGDGDGRRGADERLEAVSPQGLVWYEEAGWVGFEFVGLDLEAEEHNPIEGFDLVRIELGTAELAGTLPPEVGPEDRLATLSSLESHGLLSGRPVDQPATSPFSIQLDEPLDPARIEYDAGSQLSLGLEQPALLADLDGSGDVTMADEWIGELCSDHGPVWLLWVQAPETVWAGISLVVLGLPGHWSAVVGVEEGLPVPLEAADASSVEGGPVGSCG